MHATTTDFTDDFRLCRLEQQLLEGTNLHPKNFANNVSRSYLRYITLEPVVSLEIPPEVSVSLSSMCDCSFYFEKLRKTRLIFRVNFIGNAMKLVFSEHKVFVILQLLDGFFNIIHTTMNQFFGRSSRENTTVPSFAQFLARRNINDAVVQVIVNFWHVLFQK